jgi:nicotinate-nucleotide pyrophosphorylase (carboxylating)
MAAADESLEELVARALAEDLGAGSDSTVPAAARARARIVQKEPGVAYGLTVVAAAMRQCGVEQVDNLVVEGQWREDIPADVVFASGPARALLAAERTALNFLGHLSGVATLTARFVEAVAGTGARILDTRKTTPGLRAIEKYAVRCGGGHNHRFGLHDAVLIKDNHIAVAGGVGEAVRKARAAVGASVKVEVEVGSLAQLEEAMSARADIVMLDNMSLGDMREAVGVVAGRAVTEASGNVTADTVAAIAETGVDTISSGWITHSAPALDLGLDFVSRTPAAAASERERSSRPRPRA